MSVLKPLAVLCWALAAWMCWLSVLVWFGFPAVTPDASVAYSLVGVLLWREGCRG